MHFHILLSSRKIANFRESQKNHSSVGDSSSNGHVSTSLYPRHLCARHLFIHRLPLPRIYGIMRNKNKRNPPYAYYALIMIGIK